MTKRHATLNSLNPEIEARIGISTEKLVELWKNWGIESVALFGSVLRADFGPDSDIDFLVSFRPDTRQGLLKQVKLKHELESLTNREVDIVVRQSIEESDNWIRQREILTTAKVIYEQR